MKKILLNLGLLLLAFALPVFSLDLDQNEVLVRVTSVPVGVKSLFIPMTVSSNDLDFYQIQLKDIFVKGYLASLEKDENKKLIGISFAALQSKSLPEQLEAIIKVRPASLKDLTAEGKEQAEKPKRNQYPKVVSFGWNYPWAYTKPTKRFEKALVGFNVIDLASNDSNDVDKKELKRKRNQLESRQKDFYVKSFGQPIVRSQINSKSKGPTDEFTFLSFLRQASIFISLPDSANVEKVYVPLMVDEPDLLKIEVANTNLAQGAVIRVLNNSLLEISSVNNLNLAPGQFITGDLTFKANSKAILNKVKVGPVLTEPSEPVSGIGVSFLPNSIVIRNDSFPINLFK